MELYNDLGRLGLGSRFKRISDRFIQDVNEIYRESGIDLEASCFPLLFLLSRDGPLSLRQAEAALGTSQPLISQKARILMKKNLMTMARDPQDGRGRKMALTEKGRAVIEQAAPLWARMDRAMADLLHPHEGALFRVLSHIERQLENGSFAERVLGDNLRTPPAQTGEKTSVSSASSVVQ